ncbi:mannonate dehydratase [Rhabdobacter roseus]|uniref:mannonate dehydratase n=1 Tax=Rhabdobacter roseus TaxID=1655419 RepID=A0A840U4H4_9BACT|nr:mannonate dehydratase [Rhabdobacter roseus]MBB5287228.1 mannonate dehydratase [Rhabdobacter roseus]
MKREKFIKVIVAGSVGAAALGPTFSRAEPQAPRKVLMKVGCQSGGTSVENLEFKARHGVYNLDGGAPRIIPGKGWDLEDSLRKREACEKYGISLDAYHWPLTSAGIDKVEYPNIMLGKSPERDREIEILQQMIQVAAKTGVHLLNYNTTILPVLRTGRTIDPKRGNASYSTWNYEEALKQNAPKTVAGDVSIEQMFERITYLLDRVLPVAKEYKVKLANHIADPPAPVGYRGITRWNSPDVFAGIKRFAQLYDNEYHGFNFCIGSIAEGLKDPKTEIFPIIKWVGERKQIFNIHLRNIKGGWNNFQEVYPDNGDMNFLQVMRALRDVGFSGMVMPDHVPTHADTSSSGQAFSFSYGYIKGLLQAVSDEVA